MLANNTLQVMDEIYDEIRRSVRGAVRRDEPMKKHTSFGIGGPVDLWVEPETLHDLFTLLDVCGARGIRFMIIGRGSNLLVKDGGIRGAVICLNKACEKMESAEGGVRVGAGASLIALVKFALHHRFQGLEFCVGIPGSVGGALATNAGAWGASITECVQSALLYDPLRKERKTVSKNEISFGYRKSNITSMGIILEAEFILQPAEPAEISARMGRYISQRTAGQPLRARSAGSIFKNPSGAYAGAVIEQLGFKGYRHGGAAVSDVHANFIVNTGNATAADVLSIISDIKKRAKDEMNVILEEEIQIVGEP
jgi:UDP-N-acetylmuramate dehydrogenase